MVMLYVLPGFALTEFAAIVDVLRSANRIAGRHLYQWKIMSEKTDMIRSVGDVSVHATCFHDIKDSPDLMVFFGGESCRASAKILKSAVHWLKCRKAQVIVLSDAVSSLASIGFFDDRPISPHWQDAELLGSTDSRIHIENSIYSETGRIITSGGQVATFDVIMRFITDQHGSKLANLIADDLLKGEIRDQDASQRGDLRDRLGTTDSRVLQAVELMEHAVEDVLNIAELADKSQICQRQLERLFKSHLKQTPNSYYKDIRLRRAKKLLQRTSLSATDIAISTGFSAPSVFCRAYKKKFGQTPQEFRKSLQVTS